MARRRSGSNGGKERNRQIAEDIELYLTNIVEPTIRDFEANPTSRRHAFLACVVAYHTIDYLFSGNVGNSRKQFRDESLEFALIDRVAHAFRHVTSDGKMPLSQTDVIVRPPALLGELALGLSRLGYLEGGITVRGEHEHDLLSSLKLAVKYLRSQIRYP